MKPARAIPVLMYHHVSPAPGLVTVSPGCFRAQMEYLARDGWHAIGCDDLAGFLDGAPLPAKSFLITFDDGYLDNYVHAYPVLREFGLRATIFGVTGWIGEGPARAAAGDAAALPECPDHRGCKAAIGRGEADAVMLRWSEAERMRRDGCCEFHSHTHSHRRWDREIADAGERRRLLAGDLAQSRGTLSARLGVDSRHLCWPQGYYDDAYLDIARAAGFTHCYTTEKRVNRSGADPLRIGRLVAKEAPPEWIARRLRWFSSPLVGGLYARLRGN
ncbi:MAG TPA: polysaccharide deacetylase family protein [Rhodocyclaceae bacterium]